jgi:ABC-2 type transport system ATP-binding protein
LETELLRSVDLPRDQTIRALSRGMRMKAALVSSLAYRPKLLILDEPFSGLDAAVRDDLIAILLRGAEECTVFISSHDLAEIESFSSHIGYLEAGTLRFSEEMTALAARFREVEVRFDDDFLMPSTLPSAWLQVQANGRLLRFVDSRFDPAATPALISQVFPQARHIEPAAMSLRSIFVALARSGKNA